MRGKNQPDGSQTRLDGGKKVRSEPEIPSLGAVNFGSLRRLSSISGNYGYDRGYPIARYYLETFLRSHRRDVRGRVLEFYPAVYAKKLGGTRVKKLDVWCHAKMNGATIVADLSRASHIPSGSFDCIILTQVLQYVFDLRRAVSTLNRILSPNGVLLATVPGIARKSVPGDSLEPTDCWRFTTRSIKTLLEEAFPPQNVKMTAYGNVLTAISFLHGLSATELTQHELDYHDPLFEVVIGARTVKSGD